MGEDRACRYEPEAASELEQRENRGGLNVCSRPQRKAASSAVVASAARAAGAFAVSIPSIGLSNAKYNISRKMGSSSSAFYQNVCEVAVRIKTSYAESVVSLSWASYNWG